MLYEAYILKHILEHIANQTDNNDVRLFSEYSLSRNGQRLREDILISLLCDDDIIYLSKNMFRDSFSDELFERNIRRHPIWKSESEYKAYICDSSSSDEVSLLTDCMKSFIACDIPEFPVPEIINDETLDKCQKELDRITEKNGSEFKAKNRRVSVCKYLKEYAEKKGFPFDYLVLPADMFLSSFSKTSLKRMLICFDGKKPIELQNVCNVLDSKGKEEIGMYYLYYRRGYSANGLPGRIDDIADFCNGLKKASNS